MSKRASIVVLSAGLLCARAAFPQAAVSKRLAVGIASTEQQWKGLLSPKNGARVQKRLDVSQVSFYLSDPGRYAKGATEESFREGARYAASMLLRTQAEALRTEIRIAFKQRGLTARHAAETHGFRRADAAPRSTKRRLVIHTGLHNGNPFVATDVARTRLSLQYDWRHHATSLQVTRHMGPVFGRLEVRKADELQVRVGLSMVLGR